MEITFLEVAQVELDAAIVYYNSESPGLGDEFLMEVLKVIDRIKQFPHAWQSFSKDTRRCLTKRFPYGVIYQILDKEIQVVAIAHLHRKLDYWQDRI
ncbi:MAG: type II toxin-antitoxin system RelE/ParE family toxin [bacterium]